MTIYTPERTNFTYTVLSSTLTIYLFTTLLILCFHGADYSPSPLQRGILHIYFCPLSPQEGPSIYTQASHKISYHYLLFVMKNTTSHQVYIFLQYKTIHQNSLFLQHKSEETTLKPQALLQPQIYCAEADSKPLFVENNIHVVYIVIRSLVCYFYPQTHVYYRTKALSLGTLLPRTT